MFVVFIVLLLVFLGLVSVFVRFRWARGRKIQVFGEVVYVAIELGQKDALRFHFESLLGYKRVHLEQTTEAISWVYLKKNDFEKLRISLKEIRQDKKGFRVGFMVKPLVFGGYGIAKMIHLERLDTAANFRKS